MPKERYTLTQIFLLGGLGFYLLYKIVSGTLYFYINQRFTWLVALGALAFVSSATALWLESRPSAHDHDHGHEHHEHDHSHAAQSNWALLIVAVPLLLGVFVPARPLDSTALSNRGVTTNAAISSNSSESLAIERPADQRTVLDWVRAFNFSSNQSEFEGQPVDLIGFVYKDPRLTADQFLVGRFAVTCCVADAFAIGVIIESQEAGSWAANTWVHVKGHITTGTLEGDPFPLVLPDEIVEVDIPAQPYLFP